MRPGWWTSRGEGGRAAPEIQMSKDLLNYLRIIEKGNHPHLLLADRALQWVDMPRLADEIPPLSGWEFPGRRRRAWREGFEFGELGFEMSAGAGGARAFAGAATHLVGVLGQVCRVRKKAGRPFGRSRAARRTAVIVCWATVQSRFRRLRPPDPVEWEWPRRADRSGGGRCPDKLFPWR